MYFFSTLFCIGQIAYVYHEGKKEGSEWNIYLRYVFDVKTKEQHFLDSSLQNFMVLSRGFGWEDDEIENMAAAGPGQELNSLPYTFQEIYLREMRTYWKEDGMPGPFMPDINLHEIQRFLGS